jgi:hypothetical protein
MIRRVPFPDLAGRSLVELMNQVVEISGSYFAALPPIELRTKGEERPSELPIVGDGRPLSNQPFDDLLGTLHGRLLG